MDRDAPLRSPARARRAGVAVTLVVLASIAVGAGPAAADGLAPGRSPGGHQPAALARAGAEPATPNWIDGGPVVPLLLVSTVAMLAMGCGLLWSRCRSTVT